MQANNRWIAGTNCYICQRWQPTCFFYQPKHGNILAQGSDKALLKKTLYNLNGSFESLMMGFGDKVWENFQMMSALDFVRCYDPKFLMPEEYVEQTLASNKKKLDE